MPSRSRDPRSPHRALWPKLAGLVALTALAVGLSYAALARDVDPPGGPGEAVGGEIESKPFTYDLPPAPALSEVMARLADKKRPFRIALLGDSTGISQRGWQMLTAKWLGRATGRPVTVKQWFSSDQGTGPDGYYDPYTLVAGDGAAIEFYNGSAGGTGWKYSAENIARILPKEAGTFDLFLINHGHNVVPMSDYLNVGDRLMNDLLADHPGSTVLIMKQNPESPETGKAGQLAFAYAHIDWYSKERAVESVDVNAAFEAQPNPLDYIDKTLFHPTPAGYKIWFNEVKKKLAPLLPA